MKSAGRAWGVDIAKLTFNAGKVSNFWYYCSDRQTSEFYQDETFLEGPQLPLSMSRHCSVEVEPGFVFLSGNEFAGGNRAFAFDPATGAFESLADMTQSRKGHGCGVVNKGDS